MTWVLIFSVAVNATLLILLFMSARRRSEREKHYETLYRRALIMYADLSQDYINLLSCLGTGFVPKRLNKTPSVNDILSN